MSGVGGTELGPRPSSARWAGVRGMSERSSGRPQNGLSAMKMLKTGINCTTTFPQPRYVLIGWFFLRVRRQRATLARWLRQLTYSMCGPQVPRTVFAAQTASNAHTLATMVLTFVSEKVAAALRRSISANRGCRQPPGLSVPNAAFLLGVAAFGVDAMAHPPTHAQCVLGKPLFRRRVK